MYCHAFAECLLHCDDIVFNCSLIPVGIPTVRPGACSLFVPQTCTVPGGLGTGCVESPSGYPWRAQILTPYRPLQSRSQMYPRILLPRIPIYHSYQIASDWYCGAGSGVRWTACLKISNGFLSMQEKGHWSRQEGRRERTCYVSCHCAIKS